MKENKLLIVNQGLAEPIHFRLCHVCHTLNESSTPIHYCEQCENPLTVAASSVIYEDQLEFDALDDALDHEELYAHHGSDTEHADLHAENHTDNEVLPLAGLSTLF